LAFNAKSLIAKEHLFINEQMLYLLYQASTVAAIWWRLTKKWDFTLRRITSFALI